MTHAKHRRHRRSFSYSHCIDEHTDPPSVSFKKVAGWIPEKKQLGTVTYFDRDKQLYKKGSLCEDGVSISTPDGVYAGIEVWMTHAKHTKSSVAAEPSHQQPPQQPTPVEGDVAQYNQVRRRHNTLRQSVTPGRVVDCNSIESWEAYAERLQLLNSFPSLRDARRKVATTHIDVSDDGMRVTGVRQRSLTGEDEDLCDDEDGDSHGSVVEYDEDTAWDSDGFTGGLDAVAEEHDPSDGVGDAVDGRVGDAVDGRVGDAVDGQVGDAADEAHDDASGVTRDDPIDQSGDPRKLDTREKHANTKDRTNIEASNNTTNRAHTNPSESVPRQETTSNDTNRLSQKREHHRTPSITQDAPQMVNPIANSNISLYTGDITNLNADAIVVPATSTLQSDGNLNSVCAMTHLRSGPLLHTACVESLKEFGVPATTSRASPEEKGDPDDSNLELPHNSVVLTPSYQLPCRYIIHAYLNGECVESRTNGHETLESCYLRCFEEEDPATGMVFPTLAVSCLGLEMTEHLSNYDAARCLVRAARRLLEEPSAHRRVIICVNNALMEEIFEQILEVYFPILSLSDRAQRQDVPNDGMFTTIDRVASDARGAWLEEMLPVAPGGGG